MQVERAFDAAMTAFGPFEKNPVLAVALSGGADSTALCLLAHKWACRRGGKVAAFIVDHGLRPSSGAEAERVAERFEKIGVSCRLLTVKARFSARVEERARQARYALLEDACAREGCLHLLTGHHADDQAETVLMRRAKKSGMAGLAGISPQIYRPFGEILRPLLALGHDDLCAYNRQNAFPWEEDETNADGSNARGRLRVTMSRQERNDALKIAETARIKRNGDEKRMARLAGTFVFIDAGGGVAIEKSAFTEAFADCFAAVLRFVGQTDYVPNTQKTAALMEKIVSDGFKETCLNGCAVFPAAKGTVYICPEKSALPPPVVLTNALSGSFGMWTWAFDAPQTGVLDALKNRKNPFGGRRDIPKRSQSGLPCFFNKQGLFLAPHLEYKKEETGARLFPSPKNAVCPHAVRV